MAHPLNSSVIYSPAYVERAAAAHLPSRRLSHRCIECLRHQYRQTTSHPNPSARLAYTVALLASSLFLALGILIFSFVEGIYDLGSHFFSVWFPRNLPNASRVSTLDVPLEEPSALKTRSSPPLRSAQEIAALHARIKNLPKISLKVEE